MLLHLGEQELTQKFLASPETISPTCNQIPVDILDAQNHSSLT